MVVVKKLGLGLDHNKNYILSIPKGFKAICRDCYNSINFSDLFYFCDQREWFWCFDCSKKVFSGGLKMFQTISCNIDHEHYCIKKVEVND
jgi:hypothetical protein|tara:strand:- start:79 stop:348 length:270 start_codon:yes stop_codon:yes gene_type:complete